MTGMRMSMMTTSARTRLSRSRASAPFSASPTTSMSSAAASTMANPARISGWSSTTATRIGRSGPTGLSACVMTSSS